MYYKKKSKQEYKDMNKLFLKEVKNNLKVLMKDNHFLIKGQSYIRIVNRQILQIVNFQGHSGGNEFTINVGIEPLCVYEYSGISNPIMRIGSLFFNRDKWWNYTEESKEEVIDLIKNKLLPLLDSLSDYKTIDE